MAKKPKPTKPPRPQPIKFRYRSAVTGRYVTRSHARRNPRTTVRETSRPRRRRRRRK